MLQISNLYKQFGALVAVNNLNLKVNKGETIVLMGPSGCGKSTTIRMINRLIEPDRGSIMLAGQEINGMNAEDLRAIRKR
ncbi:MAG: ATP-binding cassette domain-containing protein, partial [Negativicutes bacterium]|nr:ATP-binding cassette domain-containing protein [Negativicutes bacterium]